MTNNLILLDEQIALLKTKQEQQFKALKEHLQITGESLKPINILKSTATEVVSIVTNERNILNKMVEIGKGEIKRKVFSLIGNNKVGRLLGRFL